MQSDGIKVGIVSCSGEDFCEGTISRLATRKVLEELRPAETVTICLPLFLAGDEQERLFAQFQPTITVDGCDKLCAKRGTERYSGPVSAALVVTQILEREAALSGAKSTRRLSEADRRAIDVVAQRIADEVDSILGQERRRKEPIPFPASTGCICSRSVPVGFITVNGQRVTIAGLPVIFRQMAEAGLKPEPGSGPRLLETVMIYNQVEPGQEPAYREALVEAYREYCAARS